MAKELQQSEIMTQTFCGTPAYISPEMLAHETITKEIDIYGLGAVLHEMLTGVPPFFHPDQTMMFNYIKAGKLQLPPELSANARDLLTASFLPKAW